MKFRISHVLMVIVIVALTLGWWVDRCRRSRGVPLPNDPLFSALERRFGLPDEVTGSGRAFLHYDLENGDRITIAVSGNQILGLHHNPKHQ